MAAESATNKKHEWVVWQPVLLVVGEGHECFISTRCYRYQSIS